MKVNLGYTMKERFESILGNMAASKACIMLHMWAERHDIQNMYWGGREWKDLNPSFAQELEAIAKFIGEQHDEIKTLKKEIEKLKNESKST